MVIMAAGDGLAVEAILRGTVAAAAVPLALVIELLLAKAISPVLVVGCLKIISKSISCPSQPPPSEKHHVFI